MDELAKNFPPGVHWEIGFDLTRSSRPRSTKSSYALHRDHPGHDRGVHLPAEMAPTLIPALAVPVSIIGTFFGMRCSDSRSTCSRSRLVLSIGIVVDDAIIVIENVERIMEDEQRLRTHRADRAIRQLRRR